MILHICSRTDWEHALQVGEYRAASLETEGFIHTSRPEQVVGVANRYYRGVAGLVVLWIDPARLQAHWQSDPVGDDFYPHIYGPLNLEAVMRVTPLPPDADGGFTRWNEGDFPLV